MALNTEVARAVIDIDGKAARQKIRELTKESTELKKALAAAKFNGDTSSAEKLKRKLAELQKQTDQAKRSMYDLDKVLKNLNGSSIKDLERAQRQLTNEIRNGSRASKEEISVLKAKGEQLRAVKAQLAAVKNEMNLAGTANRSFFSRMAEGMNRYFLAATAAVGSFTAIIMGGKKAVQTFAEFDDKVADVQKTTQLTRDQVLGLNEEFKKIDTRSAQLELLDLARVAGKLGLTAEQDVQGFVNAADKIKVALSEDLGGDVEESINAVGKLVDIFKIKQEFGIEEGMLKTGSAINALGAASTANEGYLVEFTKRVAGVAPTANISIQNILGLGATLDQLGQQSEVASTVFSQIIPDMFRNTATYAKVAGMNVKDFSDLLKKDANEAMIRMLTGLNGNNAGMEHMVKVMDDLGIEGKRSISVLGVLANNVDILRASQALSNEEFRKGTSLTEEFNTKNNTMQARLEKARKNLYNVSVELGESLAPALQFSTNSMTYMIKVLNWVVNAFKEYRNIIIPTALAIGVYTVAVNASMIMTKLFNVALKIATTSMRLFNATAKMNPLAALAAGVVALGSLFYMLSQRVNATREAIKVLKKTNDAASDSYAIQAGKLDYLVSVMNNERLSLEARRKAIDELNKIVPEYNASLSDEGELIRGNEQAMKAYLVQLERQTKYKAAQDELQTQYEDKRKREKAVADAQKAVDGFDITDGGKIAAGEAAITAQLERVKQLAAANRRLNSAKNDLKITILAINELEKEVVKSSMAGFDLSSIDPDTDPDPLPPGDLATKYEELGKQIEAARVKLQEFAMAGNLSEALKAGQVLKELENAKRIIDYIIAAGGNIEEAIDSIRIAESDAGIKSSTKGGIEPEGGDLTIEPLPYTGKTYVEPDNGFDNEFYLEGVSNVSDAAFDIYRNKADARFDYEMAKLEEGMNRELSVKNLTEAQKDKIQAKYAAKERKLKQDAWKKQHKADIISGIMKTALAVLTQLSGGDPYTATARAIAAGIAGSAQTAVIASQKMPSFFYGGASGKGIGVRDSQGEVAGIVHAEEYVIPEWMRKMPVVIAFERVLEGIRTGKQGNSQGSSTPAPSASGSTPPAMVEKSDLGLKDAIERLNKNIEKGIRAKMIYQDFERFEEKVNSVEKSAGF